MNSTQHLIHFKRKRILSFKQNIEKTEDRRKIQTQQKETTRLQCEVNLWKEKYLELHLSRTNTVDLLG